MGGGRFYTRHCACGLPTGGAGLTKATESRTVKAKSSEPVGGDHGGQRQYHTAPHPRILEPGPGQQQKTLRRASIFWFGGMWVTLKTPPRKTRASKRGASETNPNTGDPPTVHPVGLGCGFKAPRRKQAFQKEGLQKPTLTQETLPWFTLWAWGVGLKHLAENRHSKKRGFRNQP